MVSVVMNGSYGERFWPQIEFFMSTREFDPRHGMQQATDRCSVKCIQDLKDCADDAEADMMKKWGWINVAQATTILGDKEVPFGLIESAWGGTEVQNWASNASLNAKCKNLTGGKPNQAAYPAHSCNLFNGMVLPFVNMSIKGATWFQGENNCAECAARCHGAGTDPCHDEAGPWRVSVNSLSNMHVTCS